MSVQLATYSGKDVNISFNFPLTGGIIASGVAGSGVARVIIRPTVTRSNIANAIDGSVVPSVLAGAQGEIEVQVYQTSTLNKQLQDAYNALESALQNDDVSNWFANSIVVQTIQQGQQHLGTGMGPQKVPEETYGEQASTVNWIFVCCNLTRQ